MNDLDFIQKFIENNGHVRSEFLSRYTPLIYSYIHSVLRYRKNTAAENDIDDIFNEIFCMLLADDCRKLRSFKGYRGCSLASWLRQVTVNFTRDYLRKYNRVLVSLDEEAEEGVALKEAVASPELTAFQKLEVKEEEQVLQDCVEQLSIDDKYFIELHLNWRIGLEELRIALRLTRGAIDMQKQRLFNRLKDCFRRKGFALDL